MTGFRREAVRALVFDVFGTVVDWRSSVIDEGRALGARLHPEARDRLELIELAGHLAWAGT